jgi:import inner membrane translocase subunit TIM16
MALDQARQILNIEKNEVNREKILEQYEKYSKINDPDAGGSLYVQTKIWYAKEVLITVRNPNL